MTAALDSRPSPAAPGAAELTAEELALAIASLTFHARQVADPRLRQRLELAAARFRQLAARQAAA